METVAEPDGDEFALSGSKTWITNSSIADIAVLWAKDHSEERIPVHGFLVEIDRDGVTTNKIDEKLSLCASPRRTRSACRTYGFPQRPTARYRGVKRPLSCLTQVRYGIAWGAVGAAHDCFETARQYTTDREQFGKPIGSFQIQQQKLAEMATQITLAQLLADRLADLKEAGDFWPQHVSMAKRNNVRMARDQSRIARKMLGGNGITADYSPMRHMANMETVYTYEGNPRHPHAHP